MNIQLSQILFQIINFSVVLGALTYLLYKPILKILDERAERIEEAQKTAAATLSDREKLDTLKKKTKQEAEVQAQGIIAEAKKTATVQKKELLAQAREEAEQYLERVKRDWQSEKTKLQQEMREEFTQAVFTVSEKVLGESLDKKQHAKLIDQQIKSLSKTI